MAMAMAKEMAKAMAKAWTALGRCCLVMICSIRAKSEAEAMQTEIHFLAVCFAKRTIYKSHTCCASRLTAANENENKCTLNWNSCQRSAEGSTVGWYANRGGSSNSSRNSNCCHYSYTNFGCFYFQKTLHGFWLKPFYCRHFTGMRKSLASNH